MEKSYFSKKIIEWYQQHKRDLPWRSTKDPYKIWLSEIILQQTRVAQGTPYYLRFIEQFPNVQAFAQADEKEILRLWQGLGYYSRARNMHQTARYISEKLNAEFPSTYDDLLKLKGIGSYTAAAIASFAFGEKVAVLDGNVFRVLARFFGESTDISSHTAKKVFGDLANSLLPTTQIESYNQGIMELGAIQCTPVNPDCSTCPLAEKCYANATNQQTTLPVKEKKVKVRKRFFNYLVFETENKIWMKQRGTKDIWAGLFDFYLIEQDSIAETFDDLGIDLQKVGFEIKNRSETFIHILSHQRIEARFWHIKLTQISADFSTGLEAYTSDEIDHLPKAILINNYLKKYHV